MRAASRRTRHGVVVLLAVLTVGRTNNAAADATVASSATNGHGTVPTILVTARKWQEPLLSVPQSVTLLTAELIDAAGIRSLADATRLVPDITLTEFTTRRLSFPFVRGIGSGRNTPAVTTLTSAETLSAR